MVERELHSEPVEEAVRRVVAKEIERVRLKRATVTVEECAEVLGICRGLAYEGVREGWIPSIRVGRRWVVPIAGLDEMVRQATRRAFGDEPGEGAA